jgi:hypothetical protein
VSRPTAVRFPRPYALNVTLCAYNVLQGAAPGCRSLWEAVDVIHGPSHDPKSMLQTALKGFADAHDRLNAVLGPSADVQEIFIPLLETLWWTVTVDDGFESLASNGQSNRSNLGDYRNARGSDPDGQVLRAVRYARDRCGHQRALVTGVKLPTIPLTTPFVLGPVICSRPSVDLPSPDPKVKSSTLQNEYDRLLSGRPAAATLGSIRRWFEQESIRAGL